MKLIMQWYEVRRMDGKVKSREATNPLTACKKAFPGKGGHWERGRGAWKGGAEIFLNGKKVANCTWEDNG